MYFCQVIVTWNNCWGIGTPEFRDHAERRSPAGTQRYFNVVFSMILGRDVEQPIFSFESMLLISTSGKTTHFQRCFNVRFQRWNNVRFQRWNNVRFQRWNNVRFQRWNNVRFQRWNNVRFQRWNNVRFQRWNNVRFQRWFVYTKSNVFSTLKFYIVSTCICLLGVHSILKVNFVSFDFYDILFWHFLH